MNTTIILLIFGVILFIWFLYSFQFIKMKNDNIVMINGGVGAGKTFLAVLLAIKQYKKNVLKWRIVCFIKKIPILWIFPKVFRSRNTVLPKPVLYSNIKLRGIPYLPVTRDLIRRQVQVPNKSVVLLSETSLVANSQTIKDQILNEEITLFIKLFRHWTKGGSLFVETQCIADNHYALKRSVSRYYWIHHCTSWIPFIRFYKIREMMYIEDTTLNVNDSNAEDTTLCLLTLKKYYKYYDTYAYHYLTEDKPYYDKGAEKIPFGTKLKQDYVVSFIHYKTIRNDVFEECKVNTKEIEVDTSLSESAS